MEIDRGSARVGINALMRKFTGADGRARPPRRPITTRGFRRSAVPAGGRAARFEHVVEVMAMTGKVFKVGAYVSNDDPLLRVRAFIPLTPDYRTIEEAVAAVQDDYRKNDSPQADVTFVVYRSEDGDAVVEVSRGSPFRNAGFYKIAQVEVSETDAE
jgi:hypothetical protein